MIRKNRLIAALLLAGAGMQLAAMESPSRPSSISKQKQQELNNRLLMAVMDNKYDDAKDLLERGADPESMRALWYAAWEGKVEMCRLLIAHGADVSVLNTIGGGGETPLMKAVGGNPDKVRFLIENGADVNVGGEAWGPINGGITRIKGVTPLMRSTDFGNTLVVRLILTTIPLRAKQAMLTRLEEAKLRIITTELSLKQSGLVAPKDVRKMIGRLIFDEEIDDIIEDQMKRIEQMLAVKDDRGETAYDWALRSHYPEIVPMFDFNDPETRAWLRAEMEQKVREILFKKPEIKVENKKDGV